MSYIVQLQDDCWLAPWKGDPGRTLVEANARRFETKEQAEKSLRSARSWGRTFPTAIVKEIT